MKKVLIGIIVLIIIGIIAVLSIGRAPEDVERADISDVMMEEDKMMEEGDSMMEFNDELQTSIENYDLSSLNFKFTGYGPGKSHEGTFDGISIANIEHNNEYITKGTITFFVESIRTDSTTLDEHLCAENFFNCAEHKEMEFTLIDVSKESEGTLRATGNLTLKGITKQISFPVTMEGEEYKADFIVDVNQFGFTAPGVVDNEVRIEFNTTL